MSARGECEGVELTLACFDGKWLTLSAPRAWAPGSPMKLAAVLDGKTHALDLRSLGSRRGADGSFTVKARLVSLTRESRAALEAALPRSLDA